MPSSDLPHDPLDLDAVDRAIRINELEEKLENIGMGSMSVEDNCPPAMHEQFLRNVFDYESSPISCHFDTLLQAGVDLPQPDRLGDADLHTKLWEVIGALAQRDVYLYHTDHLSDRELYQHLWSEMLREEVPIMPVGSGWINHLDILGGCSEEDIKISQRYYDDEESLRHWAADFPDDVIPPHEDPPFDRDRLLPRAPNPPMQDFIDDSEEDDNEE